MIIGALVGVLGALLPGQVAAARPLPAIGFAQGQDCDTVRQQLAKRPGSGAATCVQPLPAGRVAAEQAVAAAGCGSGTWAFTRSSACNTTGARALFIDRNSGAILGWIDMSVTMQVNVSGRSNRWTHSISIRPISAVGPVTAGATVSAIAGCGLACVPISWSFSGGSALPGNVASGSGTFESTFHGINAIWGASSEWTVRIISPNTAPPESNPVTWQAPEHRCDSTLGPSTVDGCAFANVVPVHEIGRLRYPKYAQHIGLALSHGLPSTLTRTTDRTLNDLNYATACPEGPSYPRPDGHSCDEYPFRSTYQGARNQPYGRTFIIVNWNSGYPPFICGVSWLPRRQVGDAGGYSVCMVPTAENSGGGTDLGLFYYDNRVIDRDQFQVRVV